MIIETGEQLRDEGMRRAADHADAVHPKWTDRAFDLFKRYSLTHRLFMTEDVRLWVQQHRLIEAPDDQRAWGAVTAKAVRAGVVYCSHFASQKDPKSHRSPKPVWQSMVMPKSETLSQVEMLL